MTPVRGLLYSWPRSLAGPPISCLGLGWNKGMEKRMEAAIRICVYIYITAMDLVLHSLLARGKTPPTSILCLVYLRHGMSARPKKARTAL